MKKIKPYCRVCHDDEVCPYCHGDLCDKCHWTGYCPVCCDTAAMHRDWQSEWAAQQSVLVEENPRNPKKRKA